MKPLSALTFVMGALLLGSCSRLEVPEITVTPAGTVMPGTEVVLTLTVDSTEPVKYQWQSDDGGSFDNYTASTPTFMVPQTRLVRIKCTVTVGDQAPVTRTKVLEVQLADATPADPPRPPLNPTDDERGPVDIRRAGFVASGWMGDGEAGRKYLTVSDSRDDLGTFSGAQKWQWQPGGPVGWVAVAYQFPSNNWGARPGKNWSNRQLTRVTFWARAEKTRDALPVVEFKAGNGTDPARPYQDSFGAQNEPVRLTTDWRQYRIDLAPRDARPLDLSSVVTGFIFALTSADNPNGATFYLARITYEQ